MSRFFSERHSRLEPYVPGEQPKDMKYVKLNTNESPYPPSAGVVRAVSGEAERLQIYSDPECSDLVSAIARRFDVERDNVIVSNGSDEVLNFAFMAFADEESPLAFPDITYGFYPVFADLNHIPYTEIALEDDFTIDTAKYEGIGKTIVIANPNAHTGIALPLEKIERIVSANPNNVVIIDEAYVDFGAESAVKLTSKYDNLLVVQTFSKSRSMAGARLGFAIGHSSLIGDLNTIKYSTNPYNVNRMTCAAGVAALADDEYYMANCKEIAKIREYTAAMLKNLGFTVTDSRANFVFARSEAISGESLYTKLKERGILVRHFDKPRIADYNRMTIGTKEDMDILLQNIGEILEEADGQDKWSVTKDERNQYQDEDKPGWHRQSEM